MQIAQHNRQIIQQLQQQRLLLGGNHPLQQRGLTLHQASHMPLVNSPSSGNILHVNALFLNYFFCCLLNLPKIF